MELLDIAERALEALESGRDFEIDLEGFRAACALAEATDRDARATMPWRERLVLLEETPFELWSEVEALGCKVFTKVKQLAGHSGWAPHSLVIRSCRGLSQDEIMKVIGSMVNDGLVMVRRESTKLLYRIRPVGRSPSDYPSPDESRDVFLSITRLGPIERRLVVAVERHAGPQGWANHRAVLRAAINGRSPSGVVLCSLRSLVETGMLHRRNVGRTSEYRVRLSDHEQAGAH